MMVLRCGTARGHVSKARSGSQSIPNPLVGHSTAQTVENDPFESQMQKCPGINSSSRNKSRFGHGSGPRALSYPAPARNHPGSLMEN